MIFLILDTSSAYCSVALKVNKEVYYDTKYTPLQHNKFILKIIKKLFDRANVDKKSLDFIAYGVGPGSFVGVRLAAAVCQAFAVGLNIPIIGFSSMFAIAKSTSINSSKVAVVLDAKMGDFYLGLYNKTSNQIVSEKVYKLSEYNLHLHQDFNLIGESIAKINAIVELQNFSLDVSSLLDYVYQQYLFKKKNNKLTHEVFPVYLRNDSHWKQQKII